MEEIIKKIFDFSMFSNIHFVNENPVTLKIIHIKKVNGEIEKTEESNEWCLKTHSVRPEHTNESIEMNVIECFLNTLNYSSNHHFLKYFKRNIFNIFKRRNPRIIIDKFVEYDWIITSDKIINELMKSDKFKPINGDTDIKLVGKIGKTLIYKTDLLKNKNKIYLGYFNSITPLFNREISYNLEKSSINIEYIFSINKVLTKLELI
jgi:hypothetical protein